MIPRAAPPLPVLLPVPRAVLVRVCLVLAPDPRFEAGRQARVLPLFFERLDPFSFEVLVLPLLDLSKERSRSRTKEPGVVVDAIVVDLVLDAAVQRRELVDFEQSPGPDGCRLLQHLPNQIDLTAVATVHLNGASHCHLPIQNDLPVSYYTIIFLHVKLFQNKYILYKNTLKYKHICIIMAL